MTLSQLLPQAQFLLVTTPQPAAQKVARRAAEMAHKVDLDIAGVVENMSGFMTPGGERFQIFGEGGGQELADDLDVPLLGKVPLTMPLREQADAGVPLIVDRPRRPGRPGDPPGRARAHRDGAAAGAAAPGRQPGRRRAAGRPGRARVGASLPMAARPASRVAAPRRTAGRGPAAGVAFSPLGFGTTQTGRPPTVSLLRPRTASGAERHPLGRHAEDGHAAAGCQRATQRLERRPPPRSSSG